MSLASLRMGSSKKKRGGAGRSVGRRADGARDQRDQDAAKLARSLEAVLGRMPETQAGVLRWRMGLQDGQPHSTAETARLMGLSLSETREIEARAFEHIREAIPVEHLQRFLEA